MEYRRQLLTLAAVYAAHHGIAVSTVGTRAAHHGAFFRRLEDGHGCTIDRYLVIKRWFADRWPAEMPWPDGIDPPGILPGGGG